MVSQNKDFKKNVKKNVKKKRKKVEKKESIEKVSYVCKIMERD